MNKRLRSIYNGMKIRCYYKNCEAYKNYGGRVITICDEWLNSERVSPRRCSPSKGLVAFVNWALSNGYGDDLTIDRIDVNKGYSPDNCRWITKKEQGFNKRTNHFVNYKGETKTLKEWCDYLHLNYTAVKARINEYHWTVERAFETKENPNVKLITYKGKSLCLKDWCRELGLNYHKTLERISKLNWSIDKAFETKENPVHKMITYKGKTQHLASWCRELNLNYRLTVDRLRKLNWSVERAFCSVEE